ncbi:MAG: glycerol kinase GlpK [Eubacterium sp.]
MEKYIMALDQGTTSSRCILFDKKGQIISLAQKEFTQIYPFPGWVEHNPNEIWESQMEVAKSALDKAKVSGADIEAIGITNQRETTIIWDRETGEPVYNAIVWQCRRTAPYIEELKKCGFDKKIREKTGLIADAYFSATKIKWILDNVEGVKVKAEAGQLLFGTVDTWLMWKMSNGSIHATDYTNASRTMLYNIHELKWDEEILEMLDIPRGILPEVTDSSGVFGYTYDSLFGSKIPISGVAGDQQAALFGQCCFRPGEAKNTYGTGCFMLMNTGCKAISSDNGLLTTIAIGINGKVQYALEGSVFVAGAVIQWLRDEMKLIDNAADSEKYAVTVDDTNGVYIVPAFTGLGAPYWDQYAKGAVIGITRGVNKAHFIRAALESMAYQTYDVLEAMKNDSGIELKELNVDGGASANNFLMQFQADILSCIVRRPDVIETTALGAAYLAGLATGYWKSTEDIIQHRKGCKIFTPLIDENKLNNQIEGWHNAVNRVRTEVAK